MASAAVSAQLVKYDAMVEAIRACHQVDEVKDIRDKALALQAYHQQANNIEAERLAIEIRIRAERKAGDLLRDMKESGERADERGSNGGVVSNDTRTLEDLGITRDQSSKWQQLAEIPEPEFEAALKDPEVKPSTAGILRAGTPRTILTSNSDEWNTPKEFVDVVASFLRGIDLDPCSNEGEPNVPAKNVFRKADDGLKHEWNGRVYMNPPYGEAVGSWVEKLIAEHESGRAKEAIALVAARVGTKWFQQVEPYYMGFVRGRLTFGNASNPATFDSAVIYFGRRVKNFRIAFADLCWFPNRGFDGK